MRIKDIKLIKNSNFSWQLILDKLAELSWLLAIFFVAIFVATFLNTEHVFELNKVFLLRILLVILLTTTFIRELYFPSKAFYSLKKAFLKFWLWPSIFISGLALLLFFSTNSELSFFGTIDRQQGFLSYLLYFLWFILLSFNLFVFKERQEKKELESEKKDQVFFKAIRRILLAILFSGFFVAIYGILQFVGIDYYSWQEAALFTKRAFSSLGQPNFLASWLLLVIPLSFWFFLKAEKILFKFAYLLIFLSILLGLVVTSSRGAFLGLIISLFAFLFYLFFQKEFKLALKKKIILLISSFLLVLAIGLTLELSLPGRISSLFDFSGGSVSARLDFYEAAIKAIKEKPIFGYGQDNLYSAFLPYYEVSWGIHGSVGQSADKAHNLFLDILMSGGIVALGLYGILYFYFFSLVFKLKKKKNWSSLSLALGLGVFAYLSSLLFSFSFVSGEFYFFIFLALLVAIYYFEQERNESLNINLSSLFLKLQKYLKIAALIIFLVLIVLITRYSVKDYLADYYFAGARSTFLYGNFAESMTFLDYVEKLKVNPSHRAYYSRTASSWILPFYPYKEEQVIHLFFTEKLSSYYDNLSAIHPRDLLTKAKIAASLGDFGVADEHLKVLRDDYYFWPQRILGEARIKAYQQKNDEAIASYLLLLSVLPDVNHPALNDSHLKVVRSFRKEVFQSLATIYESLTDYNQAADYYYLAYKEEPLDYSLLKKTADNLYLQEKFAEALILVNQGMKLSPDDYHWPLLASYLYKDLGDDEMSSLLNQAALALGFIPE